MRQEGLTKTMLAGAAIAKNRIVKFSAANTVIQGAAATDLTVGVSDNVGADAAADTVDVILDGIALVTYGGTVAAGDALTSDATGRAIATTTAANRVIGIAMIAGVVGDTGSVRISPFLI